MNKSNDKKSDWYVPPDMLAMLGMAIIPLIMAAWVGFLFAPLFRARSGDPTMLYVAVALAGIGIVLLFFARLPLYWQRRFFAIGPAHLTRNTGDFTAGRIVLLVVVSRCC